MDTWRGVVLAGVVVASIVILIQAEKEACKVREKDRKAAWRKHWEVVRPKARHELPLLHSPSIVPEEHEMHFDTT
jgi:hypothetical protein